MFCISEESLANHIGERHCRENVQELEEMEMELSRAESVQSALTEESFAASEDPDMKSSPSVVEKILASQQSFGGANDDEKITVV